MVTTCSLQKLSHRVKAKIASTSVKEVKETRLLLHVGPTSCYYKSHRVNWPLLERLRNENKDKTKTQMKQSFNQYSENETKYPKSIQSCVFVLSSFSFRNLSIDIFMTRPLTALQLKTGRI